MWGRGPAQRKNNIKKRFSLTVNSTSDMRQSEETKGGEGTRTACLGLTGAAPAVPISPLLSETDSVNGAEMAVTGLSAVRTNDDADDTL